MGSRDRIKENGRKSIGYRPLTLTTDSNLYDLYCTPSPTGDVKGKSGLILP